MLREHDHIHEVAQGTPRRVNGSQHPDVAGVQAGVLRHDDPAPLRAQPVRALVGGGAMHAIAILRSLVGMSGHGCWRTRRHSREHCPSPGTPSSPHVLHSVRRLVRPLLHPHEHLRVRHQPGERAQAAGWVADGLHSLSCPEGGEGAPHLILPCTSHTLCKQCLRCFSMVSVVCRDATFLPLKRTAPHAISVWVDHSPARSDAQTPRHTAQSDCCGGHAKQL
jgi:hypothetical protein